MTDKIKTPVRSVFKKLLNIYTIIQQMTETNKQITTFKTDIGLADYLNKNFRHQIKNFFSDEKKALKFLSSVRADVQRNPKLLECTPDSIVNSYMQMAQMGFMPSSVSGEGYVLPYDNKKKTIDANGKEQWIKKTEAQFQIGYQGLVTLFYQAGVEKITSEIVRKNDKTSFINGELKHEIDLFKSNQERGEAVGAYVKITFRGIDNVKFMNAKDILAHGQKFSKSYNPTGAYSPWNPANDPELHMWRKTVLKQLAKNVPKNEIINQAIALDNQDSIIADRLEAAKEESESLKMKVLLTNPNEKTSSTKKEEDNKDSENGSESAESN